MLKSVGKRPNCKPSEAAVDAAHRSLGFVGICGRNTWLVEYSRRQILAYNLQMTNAISR